MKFCRVAAIIALLFSAPALSVAATPGLSPADCAVLAGYARDTWHSIATLSDRGMLPADSLRRTADGWVAEGLTSPTNIAAYLWSTVVAEDLGLISREEGTRRVGQTLTTLARLERSNGFYYNWYDPATGTRALVWPGGGEIRPFLSVVDNGWLAASLMIIGKTRPEFREAAEALLQPMNFGFFYNPYDPTAPTLRPGLLRGGYWPDDKTYSHYHYGTLNTEPRIASYIGIARGDLPAEHYYRMYRTSPDLPRDPSRAVNTYAGVPVVQGTLNYRGMELVPTWDGTMFEALMVALFVPEADWAPRSWGENHPMYVQAQIEYGLCDAQLGYWGWSAAVAPGGNNYSAYGVAALGVRTHSNHPQQPREGIIAPYASFLALPFAPLEALANLRSLAEHFPVYGPFGFSDSVDVITGQVADRVLVLDQGMILAALANVIGNDVLRRGFCDGAVEATIRPLIALERFDTRIDPSTRTALVNGSDDQSSLSTSTIASSSDEQSSLLMNDSRLRKHLLEGILTAAGLSAVMACRARITKGQRLAAVRSQLE